MVFYSKKAAEGVGALIIFIALILVAAVAAGVLIQTTGDLQSKSLDIGRQAEERVTADIEVLQIYSTGTTNGQIDHDNDNFTVSVRLGPASSSVSFENILVRFDTSEGTQSLTFNPVSTGDLDAYSATLFDISYDINGTKNKFPYLSPGDIVNLRFTFGGTITESINESETSTLRLITKGGAIKHVKLTTPSAMFDELTYLYP